MWGSLNQNWNKHYAKLLRTEIIFSPQLTNVELVWEYPFPSAHVPQKQEDLISLSLYRGMRGERKESVFHKNLWNQTSLPDCSRGQQGNTHSVHTSVQESTGNRDLLWLGPVLEYKTDFNLPCNQTARPCISRIGWSYHSEGFSHFQRPEMRNDYRKINQYQITLFINTLVKTPVIYLWPLKFRFVLFARESKKETDYHPKY